MINVVAHIRAKPGAEATVRAALLELIEPTQAEAANRGYVLHEDAVDPAHFVFYEHWDSKEAFDQHLQSEHLRGVVGAIGESLAAPLEVHVLRAIGGRT